MKKIVLLFLSLVSLQAVQAQTNITGSGFQYMQDFNTMDSNASNSSNVPAGWAIKEIGTSGSANNLYRTGTGSSNAGDTYSFGAAGSADRALGSLASNSNAPSFGARFNNTSATDTITRILINFHAEQWRAGDTSSKPDTVFFMYSLVADSVGDTVAANWIEVPSLMINSITPSATTGNGNALDGNVNMAMKNDSFNVVIAPGKHIVIKWVDKNILGSDDGLSIDDLSMTFKNTNVINGLYDLNVKRFDFAVIGTASRSNIKVGYKAEAGTYTLSVYDLNGRIALSQEVTVEAGVQTTTISGLDLSAGTYIVRMSNGLSVGVAKAIVE